MSERERERKREREGEGGMVGREGACSFGMDV